MSSEAPDVGQILYLTDSLSETNRSMCHSENAFTTNRLTGRQPNTSYKGDDIVRNTPTFSFIDGGFPVDVAVLRI